MRKLVGAVGIGLKATLKTRKLLILLNEKNAKNIGFAQVRYTAGTRAGKRNYPFLQHGATVNQLLRHTPLSSVSPRVSGTTLSHFPPSLLPIKFPDAS